MTALAVKLTPGDKERRADRGTSNAEAYDAFLRGWAHFRRNTHDDYTQARAYFERAIELDPGFGQAFSALAAVYWESCSKDWYTAMKMSRYDTRERAKDYLKKSSGESNAVGSSGISQVDCLAGEIRRGGH